MPMLRPFAHLVLLASALACAKRPIDPNLGGGPGTRSDVADDPAPRPAASQNANQVPEPPHVDDDAVERAALPFYGLRLRDMQATPPDRFFEELAKAHAICVGEFHDNPHDHWAQLQILNALLRRSAMGRQVGLGLEMVQQPYQKALDDYSDRKLTEPQLLEAVQWNARWGFSFALYRPLVELARTQHARILALNAARETIKLIGKRGVEGLDEKSQRALPELDLEDAAHRGWFEEEMKNHPATDAKREHRYTAQVVWDESMADAAARWLKERHPLRQLVILAGAGHCKDFSIPRRLKRRMPSARVVSVLPVVTESDDRASIGREAKSYDYAFVMTPD